MCSVEIVKSGTSDFPVLWWRSESTTAILSPVLCCTVHYTSTTQADNDTGQLILTNISILGQHIIIPFRIFLTSATSSHPISIFEVASLIWFVGCKKKFSVPICACVYSSTKPWSYTGRAPAIKYFLQKNLFIFGMIMCVPLRISLNRFCLDLRICTQFGGDKDMEN